jgi:cytoskeleton protein RodZ
MAYSSRPPLRTAFGRPMSYQADETTGLRWMFLLVVFAGVLIAAMVAESLDVRLSSANPGASKIGRALGYGEPKRVKSGYVAAEVEAAPASDAVTVAAAEPAAPPTEPAAQPAAPAAAPPTELAAAAVPPAAAPATDTPGRLRVAPTGGVGLVLYTAPRKDARVPRGFLEGARLTVLERVGTDWVRVRGDNGMEGWVAAQYLAPAE